VAWSWPKRERAECQLDALTSLPVKSGDQMSDAMMRANARGCKGDGALSARGAS